MAERNFLSIPRLKVGDDLDDWITDFRIWQCETHLEKTKQGPAIYMQLNDEGQECCKDIQLDDLTSADGPEFILSALHALYNVKSSDKENIDANNLSDELEENVEMANFGPDSDANMSFGSTIDEELDKKHFQLVSIFPNKDVDYLRKKAEDLVTEEDEEEKTSAWIEEELINTRELEIANVRYETLQAFFPEKDGSFLSEKCNDFSFNDSGTESFNEWICENKRGKCLICFDDDFLERDMVSCPSGHLFCTDCVKRGSNVAIGDGKSCLSCLAGECNENISIATLEKTLDKEVFSKWVLKIQAAEVEQAGIEGIEQCPFCPFVQIINNTPDIEPIFVCQHPKCSKQSCRLCKDMAHPNLKCGQVEKDAEVEKRTYIERKMTEALIRVCYKCQKPFIKQDGCNKMQCACGATMCYLCRKPVQGYNHFVGQGDDPHPPHRVCPLWSNNAQLHTEEVSRGGAMAKEEMERQKPDVKLKFDPTDDINK